MAIRTLGDIQDEFLIRGNYSTSVAFITDAILNDWLRQGYRFVANFKKWPYTEGRASTTYATTSEDWNYPEGWRPDSIRFLQIGGKRLEKLNFEDYQIFREESSSGDDRVYTDFGLLYSVNPNIDLTGTMTAWGQYTPAIDPTIKTDLTVFSDVAEEGNDAIVNEILSFAKTREKKPQEAKFYHEFAISQLNKLYEEVSVEQFKYQSHPDRGGWFKRFNVLTGRDQSDEVKRDQF